MATGRFLPQPISLKETPPALSILWPALGSIARCCRANHWEDNEKHPRCPSYTSELGVLPQNTANGVRSKMGHGCYFKYNTSPVCLIRKKLAFDRTAEVARQLPAAPQCHQRCAGTALCDGGCAKGSQNSSRWTSNAVLSFFALEVIKKFRKTLLEGRCETVLQKVVGPHNFTFLRQCLVLTRETWEKWHPVGCREIHTFSRFPTGCGAQFSFVQRVLFCNFRH